MTRLPTTTYALLVAQEGRGCDYTVACGIAIHPLRAETLEAARAEAIGLFKDDEYKLWETDRDDSSHALTEALIIRVEGSIVPDLRAWMTEQAAERAHEDAATAEVAERSLLARLQAKYRMR